MNYGLGIVGFFTLLNSLILALSIMTIIAFIQMKVMVSLNPGYNDAHTSTLSRLMAGITLGRV